MKTKTNDALQDAVMTFSLKEDDVSKLEYKISFSEGMVTVMQPYSFADVKEWTFIRLEGYKNPEDFTYELVV